MSIFKITYVFLYRSRGALQFKSPKLTFWRQNVGTNKIFAWHKANFGRISPFSYKKVEGMFIREECVY